MQSLARYTLLRLVVQNPAGREPFEVSLLTVLRGQALFLFRPVGSQLDRCARTLPTLWGHSSRTAAYLRENVLLL